MMRRYQTVHGQIGEIVADGDCLSLRPDAGGRFTFHRMRYMPGEGLVEMPLEMGSMQPTVLIGELLGCIEHILDNQPETPLDEPNSHLGGSRSLRARFRILARWSDNPLYAAHTQLMR